MNIIYSIIIASTCLSPKLPGVDLQVRQECTTQKVAHSPEEACKIIWSFHHENYHYKVYEVYAKGTFDHGNVQLLSKEVELVCARKASKTNE